jgi:branched-chain amino acid transport system permease protein
VPDLIPLFIADPQRLLDGSYYLMIALGLSLIFSLGGIVNLAHGAFYAIGAYLTVTLATAYRLRRRAGRLARCWSR